VVCDEIDGPDSISAKFQIPFKNYDKICMMTTRLACNQAIESSY
jgi:hypothetical protein